MHSTGRLLWLTCGALLWAAASPAAGDGVRMEWQFSKLGSETEATEQATIWISERRVRVEQESRTRTDAKHVLIYHGDQDVLYSLDDSSRAYVRIDRPMIEAMGARVKAARREIDARLSRLPPAQRVMALRFLGAMEPDKPMVETPTTAHPTERRERIAGYECSVKRLMRDQRKAGEVCVAEWKEVGVEQRELAVFRRLANLQRDMIGAESLTPLELVPNQPLDILVQFDGFPLRFVNVQNGEATAEVLVRAVERVDVPAALFAIPESYAQRGVRSLLGPGTPASPSAPGR